MYNRLTNGVNFTWFADYVGKLRGICIICWNFAKVQNGIEKFCCKFKNECVRLSRITFVAERFGLFAVRLPSLPRGMDLGSGITFDIFTHVFFTGCHFLNLL